MSDFVTLGELLIDFTPSGQTDGRNLFMQNAGGAVANAAVAVSKIGQSASYMGMVGNDQFGIFLRDTLQNAGVDCSGLKLSDEYNTTLAFVHLFENGERDFSFYRKPGADIMYTKDDLNTELIAQCKVFHIGTVSMTDEPVRAATFDALDLAKASEKVISLDPNYRAPLWQSEQMAKDYIFKALDYADMLKISDNEVELLFGDVDYEDAAKMLVDRGISLVYVTLGSKGAVFANRAGCGRAEGFSVNAVDATGAGDCFTGSTVCKFLDSGKSLDDFTLDDMYGAARFANAAASICVESRGGIPSMPDNTQVLKRLDD